MSVKFSQTNSPRTPQPGGWNQTIVEKCVKTFNPVPTAIGFTTWAYALRRTTAGRMGATLYLVPPVAVVMGWVVLGEAPPALALAGGALCLAGVVVARRG